MAQVLTTSSSRKTEIIEKAKVVHFDAEEGECFTEDNEQEEIVSNQVRQVDLK